MSATIERVLYGDRTITRHYDDATGDSVDGWADVAYEAVRAMNHITNSAHPIPAPVAYSVLGNVSGMAGMLPQLCDQLVRGLEASLTAADFEIYDNNGEPAASVAAAQADLERAAALARQAAEAFAAAQVAINSQGYNSGGDDKA